MRWDEVKVGDVVRVPKGTRRGPATFEVTQIYGDGFGRVAIEGNCLPKEPYNWTLFIKKPDFTGFSVKGQPEFVNGEDE